MNPWRKGLAVLCVIAAALLLAATVVYVFDEDLAQVIYDYAADPGVIFVLGLVVLANVIDSLRIRRNGGPHLAQLPRDVTTALVAMVDFRYLLQYMAKMDPDRDPVFALWDYLISIVLVVLVFEAISLWRSARTYPEPVSVTG